MSNAIYEHIKKYPDFYVEKEPAIVEVLPDKRKIFLSGGSEAGYSCFILQNRLIYFLCDNGKIFRATLTKEGYNKALEVRGMDPDAKWSIEPEEI